MFYKQKQIECVGYESVEPNRYSFVSRMNSGRSAPSKYTGVAGKSGEASLADIPSRDQQSTVLKPFVIVKAPSAGNSRAKSENSGAPRFATPQQAKTTPTVDDM